MTATAAPTRETWLDWMPEGSTPPADLMPRDEFIQRVNRFGVDIGESDLRFWEYHGVLPRAVKQWDAAAKANRVYYPPWMIATVVLLREVQRAGVPLKDATPMLRKQVADAIVASAHDSDEEIAASALEYIFDISIRNLILDGIERVERITGRRIRRAELKLQTWQDDDSPIETVFPYVVMTDNEIK